MTDTNNHSKDHLENPEHDELEFWNSVEIPFNRSKEDVWAELEGKLTEELPIDHETKVIKLNWTKVAAAAVALIFLGGALFASFYNV